MAYTTVSSAGCPMREASVATEITSALDHCRHKATM